MFSYSNECRTKRAFKCVERILPLFRAVVKCCSTNRLIKAKLTQKSEDCLFQNQMHEDV